MSKLYFTHGPMGSQKSADLLIKAHNFEATGGKVLTSKPAEDTKGDASIVSRLGIGREADFLITPELDVEAEILNRKKRLDKLSAFLVDESQFLEPGQVDQLLNLAAAHDIPVMAYGLRTDFRTHAFPASLRLFEVAHVTRELETMCAHGDGCEHKAKFNARQYDGIYVNEGNQVAIDGAGKVSYLALCATHYIQNVGPIQSNHVGLE